MKWPGAAYLMMALVGIAGIAAIAGGAIYIYVTVGSLLWGRKLDAGATSANFADGAPRSRRWPRPLRLGRLRGAGHLHAGDGVPGRLHPVLLHQLEVPLAGLGPDGWAELPR